MPKYLVAFAYSPGRDGAPVTVESAEVDTAEPISDLGIFHVEVARLCREKGLGAVTVTPISFSRFDERGEIAQILWWLR